MADQVAEDLAVPGKMSFDELELLRALSKRVPKNGKIVEVGSFFGRSTHAIARANPAASVTAIDTFENVEWTERYSNSFEGIPKFGIEAFREFTKNCGNITPIQGFSPDDVMDWTDPIDMYFEDAIHGNPGFKKNVDFWISHLKPGGIACGHDYNQRFPDIKTEVDALAEAWNTTANIVGSLWVLRKPDDVNDAASAESPSLIPNLDPTAPQLTLWTKNHKKGVGKVRSGYWAGNHLSVDRLYWIQVDFETAQQDSGLEYRLRFDDGSESDWAKNSVRLKCFVDGESKRAVGFAARLTGKLAERSKLFYRTSARQIGNGGFQKSGISDWCTDGSWAVGGDGSVAMNAITVRIMDSPPPGNQDAFSKSQ